MKRLEDLIGIPLISDVVESQQTDGKELVEVSIVDEGGDDYVEADDTSEPPVSHDCGKCL